MKRGAIRLFTQNNVNAEFRPATKKTKNILMNQRFLLPVLISAIVFTGCNDAGTEKSVNNNDSLYSGTKFNENIRATNAQTPEEERKGFKLPEGF